ncbi:MAG: c-type cytochrome, partial [Planctomycetaceae bacterium]
MSGAIARAAWLRHGLVTVAVALVLTLGWLPARARSAEPDLTTRAAQILERHCVRCHGTETRGGLSLASREQALEGG